LTDTGIRHRRILLVEDDELNRVLVRTILARAADPELRAADLVEAGDLGQARAALAEMAFDIVLLDVGLPDGDGLSLAGDIDDIRHRADRRRPAIVAMTGDSAPESRTAALSAGCDAVLVKGGYSSADLLGELAAQLGAPRGDPDEHTAP
jgi:two-component system KDP operon response regulator KdpE